MRRQLLRRMWSKENNRQYDARSGSWSPPMRRSQRRIYVDTPPDRCKACSKLQNATESAAEMTSQRFSNGAHRENSNSCNSTKLASSEVPIEENNSSKTTESNDSTVNILAYVTKDSISGSEDNQSACVPEIDVNANNNNNNDADDDNRSIENNETPSDDLNCPLDRVNESITNQSRVCQEDENRNNLFDTAIVQVEEDMVNSDVHDRYTSQLLIENLNELMDGVNGNNDTEIQTTTDNNADDTNESNPSRMETNSSNASLAPTTGSTDIIFNESSPPSKVTTASGENGKNY